MRLRPVLLLAALVAGGLAVPSGAATRGCPLVTDPRGDDLHHGTPAHRPGDDLLSADLWSDAKNLNFVVRLDGLPAAGEGATPEAEGFQWLTDVRTPNGRLQLAVIERTGTYYYQAAYGADTAAGETSVLNVVDGSTGSVDGKHATVRLHIPLSDLAAVTSVRPGTAWSLSARPGLPRPGLAESPPPSTGRARTRPSPWEMCAAPADPQGNRASYPTTSRLGPRSTRLSR